MSGSLKVPEESYDSMTILPSSGKKEDYKEKESNITVDSTDGGRKLWSDSKQKKTQTDEEDIGITEFSEPVELKKSSYRIQL